MTAPIRAVTHAGEAAKDQSEQASRRLGEAKDSAGRKVEGGLRELEKTGEESGKILGFGQSRTQSYSPWFASGLVGQSKPFVLLELYYFLHYCLSKLGSCLAVRP